MRRRVVGFVACFVDRFAHSLVRWTDGGVLGELLTLLNQYAYSPYFSPYISYGTNMENLFNNQELQLPIISFILITVMFNSLVLL